MCKLPSAAGIVELICRAQRWAAKHDACRVRMGLGAGVGGEVQLRGSEACGSQCAELVPFALKCTYGIPAALVITCAGLTNGNCCCAQADRLMAEAPTALCVVRLVLISGRGCTCLPDRFQGCACVVPVVRSTETNATHSSAVVVEVVVLVVVLVAAAAWGAGVVEA